MLNAINSINSSEVALRQKPRIRQEEFGGVLYWPNVNTQYHLLNKNAYEVASNLNDNSWVCKTPIETALIRKIALKSLKPRGFSNPTVKPSLKWHVGSFKSPLYAILEITTACAFHCDYCFNKKNMDKKNILDTNKILQTLNEFSSAGVFHVVLSGGDPVDHPDINKIVEHIRQRGMVSTVITKSGRSRIDKKIKNLPDSFMFSLDTYNENEFDFVTKKLGSFSDLSNAISYYASIPDTSVMISSAINKKDIIDLERLFLFAAESHVDRIRVRPVLDCYNSSRKESSVLEDWSDNDIEVIKQIAFKYKDDLLIDLSPFLSIRNKQSLLPYCLDCKAGKFYAKIMASGNVVPCSVLDDLVIDNLYNNSFENIWGNDLAWTRFRNNRSPLCFLRKNQANLNEMI